MNVNKLLGLYGLQLYLYLAANADGYQLELSPQAAQDAAGIRRTTFYEYLRRLELHGYLVWRRTNAYDFYTTPRPEGERTHPDHHESKLDFEADQPAEQENFQKSAVQTRSPQNDVPNPQKEPTCLREDIVIDNREATDNWTNTNTDRAQPRQSAPVPWRPEVKEVVIKPPQVDAKKRPKFRF